MITYKEKVEAIKHDIDVAKKRRDRLEALRDYAPLAFNRACERELAMTIEVIERGKRLLASTNQTAQNDTSKKDT